jgi:hypothetical protein
MGLIDLSGAPPDIVALDFNMSRDMAETLHAAYPGYAWAVRCEGEQGVAYVYCLNVSGEKAYVLKLASIFSASEWKKMLIEAGGLILELYGLRRGAANESEINTLQHNFAGKTLGYGGEIYKGVIK